MSWVSKVVLAPARSNASSISSLRRTLRTPPEHVGGTVGIDVRNTLAVGFGGSAVGAAAAWRKVAHEATGLRTPARAM